MTTPPRIVPMVFLALVLCAGLAAAVGQDTPQAPAQKPAASAAATPETRTMVLTLRERHGSYVFMAWTWLTIGVLLYFLRLKIREADRVYRTGLYGTPEGREEPPARR